MGHYGSQHVEIAEQHVEWALRAGIDAWVVSWVKESPNSNFRQGMMQASNFDKLKYCLIWESMQALPKDRDFANETAIDAFVRDMILMRDHHFDHPGYLHVNSRPVVILYVTRGWSNFEPSMVEVVKQKVGVDIFFIADDPWFQETQADPFKAKHGIKNGTQVFDAYTTYNMYTEPDTHEGQTAVDYMTSPKVMNVLQQWSESTIFFPNVVPKYHDFRNKGGKPLIGDTMGLRTQLDKVACLPRPKDFVEGSVPNFIFVTSWNEWFEGSQIEPDDGKGRRPYSFSFIDELRDFKETGRRCSAENTVLNNTRNAEQANERRKF